MTTPRKRQWRKLSAEVRARIENGGKVEAVADKTIVIKPVAKPVVKPTEVVKETPVTKTVTKTTTKVSSTKAATKTATTKTNKTAN